MRLLLVIDELQSLSAGGTERQILQLAELAKSEKNDVHLAILRRTEWLTSEMAGVPVHLLDIESWSRISIKKLRELLRLLRGFDVVQTFFVESNLIIPILARLSRVPLVIGSRRNLNYWISRKTLLLQRFSNRFADCLVANSEAVKRVVSEREHLSPERIKVIYNAIDSERFAPNPAKRADVRRALGIGEQDVVVGHVSTLDRHKGVNRFVDVAIALLRQNANGCFVLIGGGPLDASLREKIARSGFKEQIKMLGSRDDIPDLLDALDVGVLLSDTEGFSNSILEYMAKGLSVVATDVGGNAEALKGCGVLVPTEPLQAIVDQIGDLLCDERRRSDLGAKARSRAISTYCMKATQAQWRALYALAAPKKGTTAWV